MSRQTVTEVLTRVDHEPMMYARGRESNFVASMQELKQHSNMSREQERALGERRMEELGQNYGFTTASRDKPFVYSDGVAVIPVHGTLINRFHGSWGYVTGYNFIRAQMNAALDDEDVTLIVFDINSYGGECAGCFELADEIRAARSQKSLLAVVDSSCCSAAYAIGSAATRLVVTPSGQAGSIGVIAMHVSMEKALDDWGIKITMIYSGDHKADGNPYEDLPDDVKADIQASVDKRKGEFVSLVVANRPLTTQQVVDTQARSYRPDEALELKLIDAVQTPTDAVSNFLAEMGSDDPDAAETEDEDMSNVDQATHDKAVKDAAEQGRKDEQARISGILGSDEAKTRPALASHLAMTTTMSAEDARGILSKAAAETPAEGEKDEKDDKDDKDGKGDDAADKGKKGNAFDAAMNASGGTNVGADHQGNGDGGEDTPKQSRAQRAMALAGVTSAKKASK